MTDNGVRMGAAFQFQFGAPIQEGLAAVGKFDGKSPSLAVATNSNRVLVHNSRARDDVSAGSGIQTLNFNKTPTALIAAPYGDAKGDSLIIGSSLTVTAFHVDTNRDVLFREMSDGANALTYGTVSGKADPLLFVGGNCSLVGLDGEGNESYWTVTGDNVKSMALVKWKGTRDGNSALIAGSEDFEIRVFDGEEAITATSEAAVPTHLAPSGATGRFGYCLSNGTVGVYEHTDRSWRFKSKLRPTCFTFCDIDFDGVPELICGWSNGKVDIRSDGQGRRGECVYKDFFGSSVSSIVTADYRMDGRVLPMVCSFEGEVKGLVALETGVDEAVEFRERQMLDTLLKEKQQLQFDVKNIEAQLTAHRQQATAAQPATAAAAPPANEVLVSTETTVNVRMRPNGDTGSIELVLSVKEGAVIQGAYCHGEHILPGDVGFFYSPSPSETLTCPIRMEKDLETDLNLAVLVGAAGSTMFQVHDLRFRLPKFSMYVPVETLPKTPKGFVIAKIADRGRRFHAWIGSSFNTTEYQDNVFVAKFVSLRNNEALHLEASSDNGGQFIIRCDNIDICGEVLQDVAAFLGLTDVESTVDFPDSFQSFQTVLQRVDEYNAVRVKLTADMADSTQLVKALVIKAEDARILHDLRLMKRTYGSLYEVNRELIGEHRKRENNHTELLSALKEVNVVIQQAGKLRVGQPRNRLISECRNAIKMNNVNTLLSIVRNGKV
jgi:Bardet-Biedl syndrome 2 protein